MHIGNESVIAKCYIQAANDENNVCYLTHDNFFVTSKGVKSHFPLDSIMNITFQQKVLLMPIIFGGIIAPLSLIAVFNGIYNVWLMLSSMMGGLALLYYGIEGGSTLSIQTNVKEYDFFIRSISPNLKSFVSFVINFQHRGEEALIYYFSLKKDIWDKAQELGYIDPDSPIKLSAMKPKESDSCTILAVNISKINTEVKYIMDEQKNKLAPAIVKKISSSDIIVADKKD